MDNSKETRKCTSPTPLGPQGPFYIPNQPVRRDIRENKEGLPFILKFCVTDYNNDCKPLADANVHVWHVDAMGVYSGYLGLYPLAGGTSNFGRPVEPTDNSTFLRGIQSTDANGNVTFQTIFPGWYGKRTPHAHFKVIYDEKEVYVGEVYFENAMADKIYTTAKPYCDRETDKKKYNEEDPEFVSHCGFKTIATLAGDVETSLQGFLEIVVRTTA